MQSKQNSLRIGVFAPNQYHCTREALRGIAAFTREHHPWRLATEPWRMNVIGRARQAVQCDGVISIWDREDPPQPRISRSVPWVTLMDLHQHGGPCVMSDNAGVGRLAARHLLACGLQHLAFCGYAEMLYSIQRQEGFVAAATAGGVQTQLYSPTTEGESERSYEDELKLFQPWLKSLPLPVGILAANDARAITLVQACTRLGLRVPQEVAVVGVDNDQLVCEFAIPTLTSIDPDAYQVGYQGAALLQQLLQGGPTPKAPRLVPPAGLIRRGSSEVFAHEDPLVAEAFMYLRAHAYEGIQVKDIMQVFPVSRRTFEKVSRQTLGHSPHQEIRRLQIERAKELLAGSNLSISEVARRSGLLDGKYLSEVFRKELDISPSEYRRNIRLNMPPLNSAC